MKLRITCLTILALAVATVAGAQTLGVRAGVSSDPDQFVFGGHYETRPLVDRLTFKPNAEIGLGDDITTVSLNFEFVYSIPIEDQPLAVYFGGGPAMNIYSFDVGRGVGDDTDVQGGFNILVGLQHDGGLFGEFKVGAVDSPDFKFTVGYVFR